MTLFWPDLGIKERIFHNSLSSAEGILISASAVSHYGDMDEENGVKNIGSVGKTVLKNIGSVGKTVLKTLKV